MKKISSRELRTTITTQTHSWLKRRGEKRERERCTEGMWNSFKSSVRVVRFFNQHHGSLVFVGITIYNPIIKQIQVKICSTSPHIE
jgi:hypothetical protein